jgi:hypothetical protein
MNQETWFVHERHEKTRTDSNEFGNYLLHPTGELPSLNKQWIYFVAFVFFVDEMRFLG